MADKPKRITDIGAPHFSKFLPPVIKKNYGKWKYHEQINKGTMKHVSERSGHDMPAGRDIPVPTPAEMLADVDTLDTFQVDYKKRRNVADSARKALHAPVKAALV